MKTSYYFVIILITSFFVSSFTLYKKIDFIGKKATTDYGAHLVNRPTVPVVDNSILTDFFKDYSTIKKNQNNLTALYQNGPTQISWPKDLTTKTTKKTTAITPKKKMANHNSSSTPIASPAVVEQQEELLFDQYYKLETVLKKYRQIEKENTWKPITYTTPYTDLRPDATSPIIAQVRSHLFLMGDLKNDSHSDFYDRELMDGVMKYKLRNAFKPNYIISEDHIKEMNIPITDKIKTLILNMDRCREISPLLTKGEEYIMVNIPSYELTYVKNGKVKLVSEVFVGAELTKTVIFNADLEKIVFSPYWTIPQSIVKNELSLKIASDKNYLVDHNMEWINGQVRQKPGPNNSLGLVKFYMPNPYDIYMHDTPSKSLFDFEKRTFSHGCINIKRAKDLAIAILEDYPEWTLDRINQAMAGNEESEFKLVNKIPVYICYFTSWVNESGEIGFFSDVYQHDSDLNKLLSPENATADDDI